PRLPRNAWPAGNLSLKIGLCPEAQGRGTPGGGSQARTSLHALARAKLRARLRSRLARGSQEIKVEEAEVEDTVFAKQEESEQNAISRRGHVTESATSERTRSERTTLGWAADPPQTLQNA
ncbi:unnamed protein product, partial [Prorocentrum cordatum]